MQKIKDRPNLVSFFSYKTHDEYKYQSLSHWSRMWNLPSSKKFAFLSINQIDILKICLLQKCHTDKKWRFSTKGQFLLAKYYINVPVLHFAFHKSCWSRTKALSTWNISYVDWSKLFQLFKWNLLQICHTLHLSGINLHSYVLLVV